MAGDLGGQFALDLQGLDRLKHSARQDPSGSVKEVGRQFEALFLQMMLKSMRQASPQSGLFSSQQTQFYNGMLDQQWAQQLAGHGLGLAEQLTQQLRQRAGLPVEAGQSVAEIPHGVPRPLSGGLPLDSGSGSTAAGGGVPTPRTLARALALGLYAQPATTQVPLRSDASTRPQHVENFVARLEEPARAASRASGVPAELILAQAALETGWGRNQIPARNGANSHNLFGIKAGAEWSGPTTEVQTTEYVDGQPVQRVESFRVYPSYEAAFNDYARLIVRNPRYAGVVNAPSAQHAAYAMQRSGYATDPAYADKLIGVMRTLDLRPQVAQL